MSSFQQQLFDELWNRSRVVWSMPDGSFGETLDPKPAGVLSGAFNPLHEAHCKLRDVAEKWLGGPVYYEMPIFNADKPPLDFRTIERRRRQFTAHPLALTGEPTFTGKGALLPNTTFVVGVDTAERIVRPKYYGGSESRMLEELTAFRARGCRFLVAGRAISGGFATLANLMLPSGFADLFEELPESEFRQDLSSTELRQNRKNR
jgi:hypothetical protein